MSTHSYRRCRKEKNTDQFPPEGAHVRSPPNGMGIAVSPGMLPLLPQGMRFPPHGDVLVSDSIIWVGFRAICRRFIEGTLCQCKRHTIHVTHRPHQPPVLPVPATCIPVYSACKSLPGAHTELFNKMTILHKNKNSRICKDIEGNGCVQTNFAFGPKYL